MTPVPYTFLTGVLLDGESSIVIYDRDRSQEAWRKIEGEDDGARFVVDGLDAISDAPEVILAITFSYPVIDEDLATTFGKRCMQPRCAPKQVYSLNIWCHQKD
ncbi:SAVED domain-containing protein [Ruegeria sp. Ofav3-42]|uniref:SAVED domain-containing protein n=1 Tax=Ruegeria sp. Ofav3-42 TaxID=2917759 RepID=UPI001EF590DE|nr:SAVED domain-containing protein [Ruegeria sp. Ofav3-42]